MLGILGKLLLLLGKLLLMPIFLVEFLTEAITGERRRLEQQRQIIQERAPLTDQAFVEQGNLPPDDAPVAAAIRQVVAQACDLPTTNLYPGDALDTLQNLMDPGPDAPWYEFAPNWPMLVVQVAETLDIPLSGDTLDKLDECWIEAARSGRLKNLGQLVSFLAGFFRELCHHVQRLGQTGHFTHPSIRPKPASEFPLVFAVPFATPNTV